MSTDGVAIVTGGARGIGRGIASRLAADGMKVAIFDLNEAGAKEAAADLPVDGVGIACDVSDPDVVAESVAQVTETLGRPTVLVSNAGWSPYRTFLDLSREEVERVVAVNYLGPIALCHSVLPHMLEAGDGRIVFIGSDAGRVGTKHETVYAGTKAALLGFAKSLALEVAKADITINVVSPGSTDTELLREMVDDSGLESRIRMNPMKRLGTPEDLAGTVSFFCSPDARYITGQVLSVNGGMSRLG